MKKRRWNLSNILDGFHLCVTDVHRQHPGFVKEFVTDLKASVEAVKACDKPKPKGVTALYGAVTKIPVDAADEVGMAYLDALSTLPDNKGGSSAGEVVD